MVGCLAERCVAVLSGGLDSLLAGCSGCVHSHETKDDAAAGTAKSKQGSVFAWFERSGWLIVALRQEHTLRWRSVPLRYLSLPAKHHLKQMLQQRHKQHRRADGDTQRKLKGYHHTKGQAH